MKMKMLALLSLAFFSNITFAGEVKTHLDKYLTSPGTLRCVTFSFTPAFADVTARVGRYENGNRVWYGVSLTNSAINPMQDAYSDKSYYFIKESSKQVCYSLAQELESIEHVSTATQVIVKAESGSDLWN